MEVKNRGHSLTPPKSQKLVKMVEKHGGLPKPFDLMFITFFSGRCAKRETRWRFNSVTQDCEKFVYSGCGGNANNFPSKAACESRCRIGACCYRIPKNSRATIGYDLAGYDK